MCIWKSWKRVKTRIANLIKCGIDKYQAYMWGNSRLGPVSLLRVQLEVELFTFSQVYHLLFKSWQGNAHTADEDERTLVGSALDGKNRYHEFSH